jgi:Domain of unknown function DUF11
VVAAPGTIDTDPLNNTAADVDTLTPRADLAIIKTDGVLAVVPGTADTYTIVVSNPGPSAVTGATATWMATGFTGGGSVSGPASGSGALATTVDLPVNATVTFSIRARPVRSATPSRCPRRLG